MRAHVLINRFLLGIFVLFLFMPLCMGPGETLIHKFSETPSTYPAFWAEYFANISGSANYAAEGLTFSIPSENYRITRINFTIYAVMGAPNCSLVASLFALNESGRVFGYNATPAKPWGRGSELAKSDAINILGNSTKISYWFNFTGANQYEMQANTNYGIAVYAETVYEMNSTNYWGVMAVSGSKATDPGNRIVQYNASWASSSTDIFFSLYGIEVESTEISAVVSNSVLMLPVFWLIGFIFGILKADAEENLTKGYLARLTIFFLLIVVITLACGALLADMGY